MGRELLSVLHSECFVEIDDYIYFSDKDMNGMYRCRVDSWETDFLGYFPNERIKKTGLHCNAVLLDNKTIIFSSQSARTLHTFNIKDNEFKSYDVICETENDYKYIGLVNNNGRVCFVPYQGKDIMVLSSEEILSGQKPSVYRRQVDLHFTHAVCCLNEYVYAASTEEDNCIIQINPFNNEINRIPISNYTDGFEWLSCYQDGLILSSRKTGCIYKYDIGTGAFEKIYEVQHGTVEAFVDLKDYIMVLSGGMTELLLFDKKNMSFTTRQLNDNPPFVNKEYHFRFGKELKDGRVILLLRFDEDASLLVVDLEKKCTEIIRLERPTLNRDYSDFKIEEIRTTDSIVTEKFNNDLENYLTLISEDYK